MDIQINSKNVRIKQIDKKKEFIAKTPWYLSLLPLFKVGVYRVFVDSLFFSKFTESERKAIIYHEIFHIETDWCYLFISTLKKDKEQEYRADEYSAKENRKKDVISVLKKIKMLVDNNIVKYDYKHHPKIEDRILRINKIIK